MNKSTIESLREALKFSPDNIPLKQHLAEVLLNASEWEEAEKEYLELLRLTGSMQHRMGLAEVFFRKGEYPKCNVVLEEVVHQEDVPFETLLLYTRSLLEEGAITEATAAYGRVIALNPGFQDKELDAQLRLSHSSADHLIGNALDQSFLEKPAVNFNDVGGMEQVKREIDLKIIKPLQHPELYRAYGKKTGGGILLYGPPGCGKTFIAKATAGQVNARFISVGLNDILDMWIGNSEKNLHEIFELARQHTPCVLFFDEIDALGASRSDMKQSAGRNIINQFLQELDGVENSNDGILVIGATNTPWHLDTAFRRPGRFDRIIFVPPPDEAARASILELKLKNKPLLPFKLPPFASKLEGYSGADIEAIIDIAIEQKLEDSFATGIPEPITEKDLLKAAKIHKPSTGEWFSKARNFALYANEGGLYDDILTHLKIKK